MPGLLQPSHANYTVSYLQSDEIVLDVIQDTGHIEVLPPGFHRRGHAVGRVRPEAGTVVYCDAHEGVVWVSEPGTHSLTLVVSSRTRLPALEFASLTRQLVTRYLEEQGWTVFHAGAVDTPDGALLLVGNGGSGKTTLLLALLGGGSRYISNERVFVRGTPDGFRILPSPMAVAIGLGTAMQFPGLQGLIESPGRLEYPRRRFSASRVAKSPRHEWQNMDDKLQVLPWELRELLGAPEAAPSGTLRAVVVPRLCKHPAPLSIQPMGRAEAQEILSGNMIGRGTDKGYPPWIEMAFRENPLGEQERPPEELSALSAFRIDFGFNLSSFQETRTYIGQLLGVLRLL